MDLSGLEEELSRFKEPSPEENNSSSLTTGVMMSGWLRPFGLTILFVFFCGFTAVAQDDLSEADEESENVEDSFGDLESEIDDLEAESFDEDGEADSPEVVLPSIEDESLPEVVGEEMLESDNDGPEMGEDPDEMQSDLENESGEMEQDMGAPEPSLTNEPTDREDNPEESMFISFEADNEPDEADEQKIFEIFDEFYGRRVTDDEWVEIAGDRISEEYSIQSGDSLWDLSEAFFGNGHFWPKLWQLNSEITNPHKVEISSILRFYVGTLSEEPIMAVAEPVTPESSIKIPPQLRRAPVLTFIPPSLPAWQVEKNQYDQLGFTFSDNSRQMITAIGPLSVYVSEKIPRGVGEIVEVELGGNTASLFQVVYLDMPSAEIGETYTAIAIDEGLDNQFTEEVGYPIRYLGELKITGKAGGRIYKAMVTSVNDIMSVGDKLLSGKIPTGDFDPTGRPNNVVSKIVGGEYDSDRTIFGINSIVFINAGTDKGVEANDLMVVRRNEDVRREETVLSRPISIVGKVKILKVTRRFSTGVVVAVTDDLRAGDLTGQPTAEDIRKMRKLPTVDQLGGRGS